MANMHTYKLKESNFDGDGGGGAVASQPALLLSCQ
jgi:hypothetical protein